MGGFWQNFSDFWNAPFQNITAPRLFAIVGLVIVIVILWRFILAHILYGVGEV